MIFASLEQSFLLYPLVLGIYLSYQILKTTDLTVEGSFVLGAAVYARFLTEYNHHFLAILSAILGGALCGLCVAFIQKKGRMNALVAGIIMLFVLYSINLQIMGKPNINLLNYDILKSFSSLPTTYIKIFLLGGIGLTLTGILTFLLKTRTGLNLRAFGHNPILLKKYHQCPETYRIIGLMISNSLASFCGFLTAQMSGYADIHMGLGTALIGIGSVVIGQHFLSHFKKTNSFTPFFEICSCFGGIYVYFLTSHILLALNIDPINLRLFLGIILIVCLRSTVPGKGFTHA